MGQPGDPAIKNAWGTPLNTNDTLIDQAGNAFTFIDLTGLTTYAVTVANGAPDQARSAVLGFVGTLASPCTVTLPNVPRVGWTVNLAAGNQSVTLTTGAGTQAVIPADGAWRLYNADGVGNIIAVNLAFPSAIAQALTLSGLLTPNGGIAGLATPAIAGQLGQLIQGSGINVAGTSGQHVTILNFPLPGGDWDVEATVEIAAQSGTMSQIAAWVNTVSAQPTPPAPGFVVFNVPTTDACILTTGRKQFTSPGGTQVFIGATANYPGAGNVIYNAYFQARRMH